MSDDNKTLLQPLDCTRPLFKLLKKRKLEKDLVQHLQKIVHYCQLREFVQADGAIFDSAISHLKSIELSLSGRISVVRGSSSPSVLRGPLHALNRGFAEAGDRRTHSARLKALPLAEQAFGNPEQRRCLDGGFSCDCGARSASGDGHCLTVQWCATM